jgi:hypothetical protein
MNKFFNIALLAAALGACTATTAIAGPVCPPGTEAVGATNCVTRGLAASMRLRSNVMNEQKIGYNYPIPPRLDNTYPKNFDVNRFEFSQAGNFSTEAFNARSP